MPSSRMARRTGGLVAFAAACTFFTSATPAMANGGPVWDDTPPAAADTNPANDPIGAGDQLVLDRINALPDGTAPSDAAAAAFPGDADSQQAVVNAFSDAAADPAGVSLPSLAEIDASLPAAHGKIPTDASLDGYYPPGGANAFCRIPVVRHLISSCSSGRWELKQVKIMRCIVGHSPYWGWFGPAKLVYWAQKCASSSWRNW